MSNNKGRWVLYYETPDGRMLQEQTFSEDPMKIIVDGADGVLKDKNRDLAAKIAGLEEKLINQKAKENGKAKTKRKSKRA